MAESHRRFVLARSPESIALGALARRLIDEEHPGEGLEGQPRDPRRVDASPGAEAAAAAWTGAATALEGRTLRDLDLGGHEAWVERTVSESLDD
ncbi:MAG: hypothetical protein R3F20_18400 [Planctomycetota bacterium]